MLSGVVWCGVVCACIQPWYEHLIFRAKLTLVIHTSIHPSFPLFFFFAGLFVCLSCVSPSLSPSIPPSIHRTPSHGSISRLSRE
mmetsp:Transcript_22758/g.56166  ORF Transcript_22758/g.56166 Transcript_22758/m.56166 type:complete len:84 (-) Transcript_22758:182-433(-)